MKVFPDSKVYIISGCPCDPDYEHTLYWPNKEGQHAYFMTKAKYRLDAMSYQRAKRGRIRVQYKVEDLYDCNYLAFQNTSFGNKWFYAFIDDVTYVNNITSEISYTIDVIQTWITDMELQQCFISREHSATDALWGNLVPENIDIGTAVAKYDYKQLININQAEMSIIVAQIESAIGTAYEGGFYGKTYSQIKYYRYPCTEEGVTALTDKLQAVGFFDNADAVVSIFMCPTQFIKAESSLPYQPSPPGIICNANEMETLTRSDGSSVKNKKLQTYPFTFMRVTNVSGGVRDFAYEYFEPAAGGLEFAYSTSYSDNVSITIVPRGYKVPLTGHNYDENLTYTNFPKCPYAVSDFVRRISTGVIGASVGALAAIASGGTLAGIGLAAASSGMSSFNSKSINNTFTPSKEAGKQPVGTYLGGETDQTPMSVNQFITQAEVAANMLPDAASVLVNPGSTGVNDLFNAGIMGFYYTQMQPKQEYIDRIDDYFSRYGYKTNLIKTPNISSRPHWNYVQTVGCKIGGSIPCTDEKLICSIFDKGVTFWKHPEEVGNFSLDNSPT